MRREQLSDEHRIALVIYRLERARMELFREGGGEEPGEGDLPYEIEPYLTEIDTEKIDADYMNRNFERYLRALEQENVTKEELDALLDELSSSYALLSREEQRHAEIFHYALQAGEVELVQGKTFREYIADYMADEVTGKIKSYMKPLE
ncbi:MAG: type I restriction endonuclease subunit R, EcoR124 family [Fermentimonas sp.]|jgi:type I restriction enzyme R subunit